MKGDVIGLACDLDAMNMHVSVNGKFDAPNGVVFKLDRHAVGDGLFVALSGKKGKVRFNLGPKALFRHAPPADFQAFAAFEAPPGDSQAALSEAAQQLVAASNAGENDEVEVDVKERTVAFTGSFATVRSAQRCPRGAKGYYELEILDPDNEAPQYGFAATSFEREDGSGEDSWVVDGARQRKWYKSNESYLLCFGEKTVKIDKDKFVDGFKQMISDFDEDLDGSAQQLLEMIRMHNSYKCTWKKDDVIGFACDLQAMCIHVSVNGKFEEPNGVVFPQLDRVAVGDGLFAALSGLDGRVRFNLGEGSNDDTAAVEAKFAAQGKLVRVMNEAIKADANAHTKDELTAEVNKLKALKAKLPFKHAPPAKDFKAFAEFETTASSALALFRGENDEVEVDVKERTVAFMGRDFVTVRSAQRCPLGAKGYYELEILEPDHLAPQYGFAASAFERVDGYSGAGVGDDAHSWAVDGARQRKWHESSRSDANIFKTTTDALHEAFRELDKDHDGVLSRVELTTFSEVVGQDVQELLEKFNQSDKKFNQSDRGLKLTYLHKSALELKNLNPEDSAEEKENEGGPKGPEGDVRSQWVCASVVLWCVCVCICVCVCL